MDKQKLMRFELYIFLLGFKISKYSNRTVSSLRIVQVKILMQGYALANLCLAY